MSYTPEIGRRFWFELDKKTLYTPSFMDVILRAGAGMVQTIFSDTRIAGTYPASFLQFGEPHKADWRLLADTQKSTVDGVLGSDWADIQAAFEDFGQGTLLDTDPERAKRGDWIHTMDVRGAAPPVGYHRWHASVRMIQLLGIGQQDWWENLDRMIGLAWGIQSFARPKQRNMANPPIAQTEMQALRDAWLPLDPDRRDRQYDLTGDVGYHPAPKLPVA